MRDYESPEPSAMPPDEGRDGALHISSLRPETSGFSMRRLLNRASAALAGILLLTLAIHWLPGVFSAWSSRGIGHPTRTSRALDALLAPARGSGWQPIGPDWATDISFAANGALGYACGAFSPVPLVHFAAYDVHQRTWKNFPTPATATDQCHVSVSPVDAADVVLVADSCLPCTEPPPTSQAFRTYDGGSSWAPLLLPPSVLITDIAWTTDSTLFLAAENTTTAGTSTPPTFSLLVSRENGPLTAIDARQLLGRSGPLGNITLLSGGTTIYASLTTTRCPTDCTQFASSSDDGHRWTPFSANTGTDAIFPQAAQPNSTALFGSTFSATSQTLALFRSDDSGANWHALPTFPSNPLTGGATVFALPDDSLYAFCFGPASTVYAFRAQTNTWETVAALPDGLPLTVQYNAGGHAVALWGQAHEWSQGNLTPGLEYYPLV